MSDNKLNGWYWVTHGGETFPSQFTDGLSDIVDADDTRIPANHLRVGPRIQEVQAFDPATVKVGDEVMVRGKVITIDKDDRTIPFYVELGSGDKVWFRPGDISGVMPAPELPRRDDGWSADGKSVDPWHGVGADERDRRCEAARRAVEDAHRPSAKATAYIGETKKTVWVHLSQGVGAYFGVTDGRSGEAITDKLPHDNGAFFKAIPLSEAHAMIHANLREEFCRFTGYVPPKQCEGWRFTSAIGEGCYGFHASGRGFYCGFGATWYDRPSPSTFDDAVGGSRHEITAAAAYEICRSNGQGAKFCEITGYKP